MSLLIQFASILIEPGELFFPGKTEEKIGVFVANLDKICLNAGLTHVQYVNTEHERYKMWFNCDTGLYDIFTEPRLLVKGVDSRYKVATHTDTIRKWLKQCPCDMFQPLGHKDLKLLTAFLKGRIEGYTNAFYGEIKDDLRLEDYMYDPVVF